MGNVLAERHESRTLSGTVTLASGQNGAGPGGAIGVGGTGQLSPWPRAATSPSTDHSYDYLEVPTVVDGTLSVSGASETYYTLFIDGSGCTGNYDGSITVASGGAVDLAADDSDERGYPLVYGQCNGSPTITVQTGGALQKTAGTGTSTISSMTTTVQGTLKATSGALADNTLVLQDSPNLVGNVLPNGAGATCRERSRWPPGRLAVDRWPLGVGGTGTADRGLGRQPHARRISARPPQSAPVRRRDL